MILVVDDERTFTFPAIYRRTSAAAVAWLENEEHQPLDILYLDHDLGGDDTTLPVVDLLCRMALLDYPYPVDEIYVHSMNPSGADTIVRCLDRAGYNVFRITLPEGIVK